MHSQALSVPPALEETVVPLSNEASTHLFPRTSRRQPAANLAPKGRKENKESERWHNRLNGRLGTPPTPREGGGEVLNRILQGYRIGNINPPAESVLLLAYRTIRIVQG